MAATGWEQVPDRPKRKKKSNWRLLYSSRGETAAQRRARERANVTTRNKNIAGAQKWRTQNPEKWAETSQWLSGQGGFPGSRASGESESGYPAFSDRSGQMLAELAASRDRQIARLRGDLEGRAQAVTQLYGQQAPLIQGNYNRAIQSTGAVNEAVASRLATQGGAAQTDLLSKLALVNAPGGVQQQTAKQLSDYYGGLGGANYAMDAGDIQRLIGRLAEEETITAKGPAMIRSQLEAEFGQTVSDLMEEFLQQEAELRGQGAEAQSEYEMNKWQYEQEQKAAKEEADADRLQDIEDRRMKWYEIKQRERLAIWAASDKRRQAQLERQWDQEDAAQEEQWERERDAIKHGYTLEEIQTREAVKPPKSTKPAKPGPRDRATRSEARRNAEKNVFISVKGQLKIRGNLKSDSDIQTAINESLRADGINPWGPEGTAIRKAIFAHARGRRSASSGQKYTPPKYTKTGRTYKPPKKASTPKYVKAKPKPKPKPKKKPPKKKK